MRTICLRASLVMVASVVMVSILVSGPQAAAGKVLLITIDGVPWPEFSEVATGNGALSHIVSGGSVGLMNVKAQGSYDDGAGYLSIGAGDTARGHPSADLCFEATEIWRGSPASDTHHRLTGADAVPEQGALCLSIIAISREAHGEDNPYQPGLMGEALHSASMTTAVIGGSDLAMGRLWRPGVLAAMDDLGRVDWAVLRSSDLTREDPQMLNGLIMDSRKISEALGQAWSQSDLVVLDWADTGRLEEGAEMATASRVATMRDAVWAEIEAVLAYAIEDLLNEGDTLILASPTPTTQQIREGIFLAPVVLFPGNGGILTSGTTKRPGLVANMDIAATILERLGVQRPPAMVGQTMTETAGASMTSISHLDRLWGAAVINHLVRPTLIKSYVTAEALILVAFLALLLLGKMEALTWKPVQWVLLAILTVPAAMLILPLATPSGLADAALHLVTITVIIVAASMLLGRRTRLSPVASISVLTAVAVLVDILLGSPLMKTSPLGYSPMAGARYYGIGNEYMGVLLGSAVVGGGVVLDNLSRRRRPRPAMAVIVLLFLGGIVVAIAHPGLGANFGGAIASAGAVTYAAARGLSQWRQGVIPPKGEPPADINTRALMGRGALILLVTAAVISIVVMVDLSQPKAEQSHLARAVSLIGRGGIGSLVDIAVRKVSMNARLFRYTIWSRVFLVSLGVMAFLFLRPAAVVRNVLRDMPWTAIGLSAAILGALIALAVNDSGVVAAATAAIYPATTFLYLSLLPEMNGPSDRETPLE